MVEYKVPAIEGLQNAYKDKGLKAPGIKLWISAFDKKETVPFKPIQSNPTVDMRLYKTGMTPNNTLKTGKKISLFCTNQAEYAGVTLRITGSIEKPCMSHLNCSGDIKRNSDELRGHEKCPCSTRL